MIGKKLKGIKYSLLITWAGVAVLAVPPDMGQAKSIYKYRDSRGVIHLTDAPTDKRFRLYRVYGDKGRVKAKAYRVDLKEIQKHVKAAAKTYGLDPALIRAIIKAESAYDPFAVSLAGAKGLMQLMPKTAVEMKVKDTFDPQENIFGGCKYLRYLLNRYNGDLKLALAAYNLGPQKISQDKKIPPVRETNQYIQRVIHYYQDYKNE
ncbi:MAG: lytic transglycosylase domain-containing protein [Deltaproteobacteria bacterium]|nr:lytic transglycosylase domain-containing protein [Deltaproteobacteria bacterium]